MPASKVFQFKAIEISYDSVAALTCTFLTDLPGGANPNALATRATLTFPLSTGRRTGTQPMDTGAILGANGNGTDYVEGTLYQIKFTSTGIVRLFGGRVWAREIGVWFDGANGESFKTMPYAPSLEKA